jgi:REP element-mobilizing transposase RayT
MAQTHVCLYLHIIFSTKNRFSILGPEIEGELFAYIGGIINNHESKLLAANGTDDHVHLLISMSKNFLVPVVVGAIKRDSSKWLKTQGSGYATFAWQDGYSVFSVGHTQIKDVKKYIADQKSHHKKTLFEDEMRAFYKRYGVDFDEQFVWG